MFGKKKGLKLAVVGFLCVMLIGICAWTYALAYSTEDYFDTTGVFYFTVNEDNTATITGTPLNEINNLTIPSVISYMDSNGQIHSYSVTVIGEYAFECSPGLTGNLSIPNGIIRIEKCAFYDCPGFTGDLIIPDSVTKIGDHAFRDCSGFNGTLTIGNGVREIGVVAFDGCSGFTGSLTISNNVQKIGSCAFRNCSSFTGSLTIGNNISIIEDNTFQDCSGFTGSLIIPNSVTKIGNCAFSGCFGLSNSLIIGNGVTSIGCYAFYKCSGLSKLFFSGNPPIIDEAFVNCVLTGYYPANNKTWTKDKLQDYGGKITWKKSGEPEDIPVTAIKLSAKSTKVEYVKGKTTITVSASVSPSDATNPAVTWVSSNKAIATVGSSGKVTFKKAGTVTITGKATDGSGVKASIKLTASVKVTSFKLYQKGSSKALSLATIKSKAKSVLTIQKGKSVTLTANQFQPSGVTNKTLVWKSLSTKVATVKNGTIKGVSKGTAVIQVSPENNSKLIYYFKVSVK